MSDSRFVTEIGQDAFEQAVLNAGRPVALDFYSTECPPCEALAPKFEALAELYAGEIAFIKVFRQQNRSLAERLGVTSSPTVLFFDRGRQVGDRLTGGIRRSALAANLDALLPPEKAAAIRAGVRPVRTDCDVAILGAGPAGIAAAIYTAQARLNTVLIDTALGGGYVSITHQVSNYPGFPQPQFGWQLAHTMLEHAKAAGARTRLAADVDRVDLDAKEIVLDGFETIAARRIVVATGSQPRPLGIPGEKEYRGQGVSYCATCDAKYCEDRHVVVIGGGNSAVEEALFITRFARRVTIVHQFDRLQANKEAQEKALAHPKIEFVFETEPRAFIKNGATVDEVQVEHLPTGRRYPIGCDHVFIFAGMEPNLEPFGGRLATDEWGYVTVDPQMRTNVPGVYAAGDVAAKRYRQITTAVADGTIAGIAIASELQ